MIKKYIKVSGTEAEEIFEDALEPKIKDISNYPDLKPDGPPIKIDRLILRIGDERREAVWDAKKKEYVLKEKEDDLAKNE